MKPAVINSFPLFKINSRVLSDLSVIVIENVVEGELCILASYDAIVLCKQIGFL